MKKLIMSMAAVSALAVAAPAAAQYSNGNIHARIDQLNAQLQTGVRARTIDARESATLRVQLRQLSVLERRYSRNGLTRNERNILSQRIDSLRQQIRDASRTGRHANGHANANGRWNVGDRYQGDWGNAARYGNDYRDSDRYYYRYDNAGHIYQVDRRNDTITRVIDRR